MKESIAAGQQYENQNNRKFDEIQTYKQKEVEERQRIEAQILAANQSDAQAQADRRLHLKAITEEDRNNKMLQKVKEDNSKCAFGDDIIARALFNRPTHEAYERRAKQDTVVNYIADKFQIQDSQNDKERLR